jgi:hypothetical protein
LFRKNKEAIHNFIEAQAFYGEELEETQTQAS